MSDLVARLRADMPTKLIEGHEIADFDAIEAERKEAASEIERLQRAEKALLRMIIWENDCVNNLGAIFCPCPADCACKAQKQAMIELEDK